MAKKKSKMHNTTEVRGRITDGFTIHIDGGYRPAKIENIHEHLQLLNSGAGCHRAKKGKGSYTRKDKHKGRREW